jgi:very-short-patch-repair endonuclease
LQIGWDGPSPLAGEGGARAEGVGGRGGVPTKQELLVRAKWMRANPTDAERRLWSMLRDKRMPVFKFKRQLVIAPYIVDFVCLEKRLVVEADGSQHAESGYDARRDAFLRQQGFEVLRFWNADILNNSSGVFDAIFAALLPPHPSAALRLPPSPARGKGLNKVLYV